VRHYGLRLSRFIAISAFHIVLIFFTIDTGAEGVQLPVNDDPTSDLVVEFSASYFARYQPDTALQMVNQVPGFQPNDGSSVRGFGAAAGNILINGRRPTAKRDTISSTLGRIPASLVERIDLIRGQVRGIELQGQSSVVNVILQEDVPAAIYWDILARYNLDIQPVTLIPTVSFTDRWKGVEYNTGFYFRNYSNGDPGTKEIFDGTDNLIEHRIEPQKDRGYETRGIFGASSWLGETLFGFNTSIIYVSEDSSRPSYRSPVPVGPDTDVLIVDDFSTLDTEIGFDAERRVSQTLISKAIILYSRSSRDSVKTQTDYFGGVETLLRLAETDRVSSESIARMELFWAGIPGHDIQANLEGVLNILDSTLVQTDDRGLGPVITEVPGANTRVEERRGNFLVKDTWSLGNAELDYGLGIERSTISQTGDAVQKRNFTFLKPHGVLTYSPEGSRQTRLRIAREVSQLRFGDFVSVSDFEDDNIDLGNPDLRPETVWIGELSQELRYGSQGVIKLNIFHHWINDVLDKLPLTVSYDVPGNIGNGRRWGAIFESTVPLEILGLADARLNLRLRWQDSSVTDPVTGSKRVLSDAGSFGTSPGFQNENKWAFELRYRQDFDQQRVAWGWSFRGRAKRPVYRVNELNTYNEGSEFNIFFETTRWAGIKVRIEGANITNHIETRDRIIFTELRDLSPVASRESTEAYNGARVILTLSGSF